jgi:predicted site-specific integrase-resolvase
MVGSALNRHLKKFLALLRDTAARLIMAQHRGWFALFRLEYVESALTVQDWRLLVVDPIEDSA